MPTITAIAFDLGGTLIKENDFPLSEKEQILERQFGKINTNQEYYQRAIKETQKPRIKIEESVTYIVKNIYELRDPDIFNRLPKCKLAIASNHLSAIHTWLKKADIEKYFDYILISADVNMEKPHKIFYKKLIEGLKESPEHILLVDDDNKNIEGAKNAGLQTLLYDHSKNLTNEVLNAL